MVHANRDGQPCGPDLDDNAHLRADLEPARVRATADLPTGRSLTFEVTRAESVPAGLVQVDVD
ncbi:MAG TPA: hypothetical protein VG078_02080, partial [Acidimicrobiales bacterium]|nr:hypothetical protein [Acidimicrobiales bacterium]